MQEAQGNAEKMQFYIIRIWVGGTQIPEGWELLDYIINMSKYTVFVQLFSYLDIQFSCFQLVTWRDYPFMPIQNQPSNFPQIPIKDSRWKKTIAK